MITPIGLFLARAVGRSGFPAIYYLCELSFVGGWAADLGKDGGGGWDGMGWDGWSVVGDY